MIPKIILQTSIKPYPQYVKDLWQDRVDASWTIDWFDDEMIYKFFADNPLPEFPNIAKVFDSFTDGGHKADLFRYYYLYLKGGFFIDSDCMTHMHMNDIYSAEHDHMLVYSDLECNRVWHPEIDSPVAFNGFMGCIPKSQIVYDALVNAYNTKPRLLEKQRLYFVYMLYVIAMKHKHKYNISWFEERAIGSDALYSPIVNNAGTKMVTHFFGGPKIIPKKIRINSANKEVKNTTNNITFFTTFNDTGYNLYGRAWIKTFIESVKKNKNIQARVYYENFEPDILHESIEYVDFGQAMPHHADWKQQYLSATKHGEYTRNQAVRFSHKAFVMQHALDTIQDDYVIWLDGDCIFKEVDYEDFPSNILDNKLLACQVEIHNRTTVTHVESGILIFNNTHADKTKFITALRELYEVKNIITMANDCVDYNPGGQWEDYGPYDGFIVHKALRLTNIPFVNLNDGYISGEFTGEAEKTFTHWSISDKFVHNISWDGKNKYTELNRQLGIDPNFEWTYEDTKKMITPD